MKHPTYRRRRWLPTASLAAALAAGILTAAPMPASQAASTDCDSGVNGRVPILLVHGYNSSVKTWDDEPKNPSKSYLAGRTGTCIATIDYGKYSTNWVTDPHIGPALATKIVDLAAKSSSSGGTGKVIVIGHSMGGLAIRCAASPACSGVDGVAQHILEAITFGTPNEGSFLKGNARSWISDVLGPTLSGVCYRVDVVTMNKSDSVCKVIRALGTSAAASAFTPGSKQLNALPAMPSTIPVYAIAGSVNVTTTVFAHFTRRLGDGGDLVVDENSALAEARQIGALGGSLVVNCGELNIADLGWAFTGGLAASTIASALENGVICDHVKETKDPSFLAAALSQIEKAVPRPPANSSAPALSNKQLLNATLPPGICNNGAYGWDMPYPLHMHNGAGSDYDSHGKFAGSSVSGAKLLGFADMNGDGRTDAVLSYDCFGSTPNLCCAGQSSLLKFVSAFSIDPNGTLHRIGEVLRGGKSLPGDQDGPADRAIRRASLSGTTVSTTEYVLYANNYTPAQVGGVDPGAPVYARYQLRNGRWVAL